MRDVSNLFHPLNKGRKPTKKPYYPNNYENYYCASDEQAPIQIKESEHPEFELEGFPENIGFSPTFPEWPHFRLITGSQRGILEKNLYTKYNDYLSPNESKEDDDGPKFFLNDAKKIFEEMGTLI